MALALEFEGRFEFRSIYWVDRSESSLVVRVLNAREHENCGG